MRFDDGTIFNCVPPQENDVPNEDTRWIQWVYGTRNTMSSSTPVNVEGYTGPWEWEGPVITLPGPVHGSSTLRFSQGEVPYKELPGRARTLTWTGMPC